MTTMKQPFQCKLQPEIQEPHRTTHTDTTLVAKHIGGTIRAWNDRSRIRRTDEIPFIAGLQPLYTDNTRFHAPTSSPTQSRCNIMQPFQCDLPPQFQERIELRAQNNHSLQNRRNNSRMKRPQPQPPHRRGTFHRRLQPLYTEKHKFRAPASSPTQSPCNIMQPFQCDLPPQLQETRRTTHTDTTTRGKTHRRNNSRMKRPQPQPPHRRGTFHRRLQPLTRINTRFRAPASSTTQSHATIMQPFPIRSATTASRTA